MSVGIDESSFTSTTCDGEDHVFTPPFNGKVGFSSETGAPLAYSAVLTQP